MRQLNYLNIYQEEKSEKARLIPAILITLIISMLIACASTKNYQTSSERKYKRKCGPKAKDFANQIQIQ